MMDGVPEDPVDMRVRLPKDADPSNPTGKPVLVSALVIASNSVKQCHEWLPAQNRRKGQTVAVEHLHLLQVPTLVTASKLGN
ncbi:hypothetical protein ACRE_081210 [Hapsidospora chrysogenum ATCC 11550]|uniref:Uncharacterized protein n=1 Tax=Hapsidospora chrysogenum (strain ATCC 11550 / CBS 779.69 / DSM 880 / IAM 14645 / JCM 23072 / IMI 49137) TaxID=857340 RepID=A0A086SVP6_HAPC1|nr:hypothetical protein ACRE_081210 [Hapsidospora chrysogenum ATCC 11550]